MGWATEHIAKLRRGETIQFRPRGQSMAGRIESGQLVTVEPADVDAVSVHDIVLCSVQGGQFLHLVKAKRGHQAQIGNNRGRINGWTMQVFGRVIKIEN